MKSLLIIFSVVIFLSACDKDESIDAITNRRIVQVNNYNGNEKVFKIDFNYKGDRVSKVIQNSIDADGNWVEGSMVECLYDENEMTIVWNSYEDVGWKPYEKLILEIENDKVVDEKEYLFIENKWDLKTDVKYRYTGDMLKQYSLMGFNNGTITRDEKADYIYENGVLNVYKLSVLSSSGTDYFNFYKEEFTSVNNNIEGWTTFLSNEEETWIEQNKFEYTYLGENVSELEQYSWDYKIDNWALIALWEYSYDEYGCLEKQIIDNSKTTYSYEDGIGNAGMVYLSPSFSIYNKPTFKNGEITNHQINLYENSLSPN